MQLDTAENPRAVVGGNNPPMSPFEEAEKKVEDIYGEAKLWLDGAKVDSAELADGIANLLKLIRDARKLADDNRETENEPFNKGKAEVQARYKPLLEKADRAAQACKLALQPWLDAEDRRLKEEARKAREEAERKEREAREAYQKAQQDAANLAERERAEVMLKDAKRAGTAANKAERKTAVAGNVGRAIALRTVYTPIITNATDFGRYVWKEQWAEMDLFLQDLAHRLVAAGHRDLPGVTVAEEKVAV